MDHLIDLKRLCDEIEIKNFGQKLTELGITKGRGWFLKFWGTPMIL
jgi:hypothetical protein